MLFCMNVYNYTFKQEFVNAKIHIKNGPFPRAVGVISTNVFVTRTRL